MAKAAKKKSAKPAPSKAKPVVKVAVKTTAKPALKKSEVKEAKLVFATSLLQIGRRLTAEGWKRMVLKPLKKDKKS